MRLFLTATATFLFAAAPILADEKDEAQRKTLRAAMPKDQAQYSDELDALNEQRKTANSNENPLARTAALKECDVALKKWSEAFIRAVGQNGVTDWVAPADISIRSLTLHDGWVAIGVDLKRCPAEHLATIKSLGRFDFVRFTIAPDPKLMRVTVTTSPFALAGIHVDGKLLKKIEKLKP